MLENANKKVKVIVGLILIIVLVIIWLIIVLMDKASSNAIEVFRLRSVDYTTIRDESFDLFMDARGLLGTIRISSYFYYVVIYMTCIGVRSWIKDKIKNQLKLDKVIVYIIIGNLSFIIAVYTYLFKLGTQFPNELEDYYKYRLVVSLTYPILTLIILSFFYLLRFEFMNSKKAKS